MIPSMENPSHAGRHPWEMNEDHVPQNCWQHNQGVGKVLEVWGKSNGDSRHPNTGENCSPWVGLSTEIMTGREEQTGMNFEDV